MSRFKEALECRKRLQEICYFPETENDRTIKLALTIADMLQSGEVSDEMCYHMYRVRENYTEKGLSLPKATFLGMSEQLIKEAKEKL